MDDCSSTMYLALSAHDKLERLWSHIMADTTSGSFSHRVKNVTGLLAASMEPVFTTIGDVLINGRTKRLHPVGVVGQVQFVPVSDELRKYTGCFDGVRYGLIRLSSGI